jgi:hypothetical protein
MLNVKQKRVTVNKCIKNFICIEFAFIFRKRLNFQKNYKNFAFLNKII